MGTYGAGIFQDDVAADVRAAFLEQLAAGVAPPEATRAVADMYGAALADSEDGPVVWLALAATQWEYGALDPRVRDRALAVIASGADLARWLDSPLLGRRKAVLERLAVKLRSPAPRFRRPRRPKPMDVPGRSVAAPNGQAVATVYALPPHQELGQPRSQVILELETPSGRGGGHAAVFLCEWDAVGLRWTDSDSLEISFPAGTLYLDRRAPAGQPKGQVCFAGRSVAVSYVEH